MARLIYAVLALAFAALVAGFFVSTTSVPLLISIALSAVVTLLILVGWSRKLRQAGAFDETGEPVGADVIDVDSEETGLIETVDADRAVEPAVSARPPRSTSRPRPRSPRAVPPTPGGRVLVIPGRTRFHAPGCRFARGDDVREVSETIARRRGYEPCTVCIGGAD